MCGAPTRWVRSKPGWGADEGNEAAHALYRRLGPDEIDPGVIYSVEIAAPAVSGMSIVISPRR